MMTSSTKEQASEPPFKLTGKVNEQKITHEPLGMQRVSVDLTKKEALSQQPLGSRTL
ncbi:hypothetical protein PAMP_001376 [Pampus punctatissimus]